MSDYRAKYTRYNEDGDIIKTKCIKFRLIDGEDSPTEREIEIRTGDNEVIMISLDEILRMIHDKMYMQMAGFMKNGKKYWIQDK